MRYYQIDLFKPGNSGDTADRSFTSFKGGKTDPNALDVEMDVLLGPYATPINADSYVRVWGISLQDVNNASDFNGYRIAVYGGMQKGLPLANPAQAGLLFQGTVLQTLGNWVDTDQTLDFYVQAGAVFHKPIKNLTFDWKKNTPLSDAIKTTLGTAFSGYDVKVDINPKLVLNYDQPGYYANMSQFATMIKRVSTRIIGGDYVGVDIMLTKKTFSVYDGSTQKDPVQIAFQDLVGQPTWIESPTIQLKTVMRADLSVGDYIKMPTAVYTTTQQAQSFTTKNKSNFQGSFKITSIRDVGRFRQQTAESWVSVIEAVPTKVASSASG